MTDNNTFFKRLQDAIHDIARNNRGTSIMYHKNNTVWVNDRSHVFSYFEITLPDSRVILAPVTHLPFDPCVIDSAGNYTYPDGGIILPADLLATASFVYVFSYEPRVNIFCPKDVSSPMFTTGPRWSPLGTIPKTFDTLYWDAKDGENFIANIFRNAGYSVEQNIVVEGRPCDIDMFVDFGDSTLYVDAKVRRQRSDYLYTLEPVTYDRKMWSSVNYRLKGVQDVDRVRCPKPGDETSVGMMCFENGQAIDCICSSDLQRDLYCHDGRADKILFAAVGFEGGPVSIVPSMFYLNDFMYRLDTTTPNFVERAHQFALRG